MTENAMATVALEIPFKNSQEVWSGLFEMVYEEKTYLKLTDIKLGLLVNFNVILIKDGIHRIVNNS